MSDILLPGFLENLDRNEKIIVLFAICFGIVFVAAAIGGLILIFSNKGRKAKLQALYEKWLSYYRQQQHIHHKYPPELKVAEYVVNLNEEAHIASGRDPELEALPRSHIYRKRTNSFSKTRSGSNLQPSTSFKSWNSQPSYPSYWSHPTPVSHPRRGSHASRRSRSRRTRTRQKDLIHYTEASQFPSGHVPYFAGASLPSYFYGAPISPMPQHTLTPALRPYMEYLPRTRLGYFKRSALSA